MIQHIVLLKLPTDHDAGELAEIMQQLDALVGHLPGFLSFKHGPNRDFENLSPQFPYGFIGIFADAQALNTYASDARHSALGARLVALCDGGSQDIMVVDLETPAT